LRDDGRAPTGASVLIASHDRNAAIFIFRGANTLLEVKDLHDDAFAVDIVYIANLSTWSLPTARGAVEGRRHGRRRRRIRRDLYRYVALGHPIR